MGYELRATTSAGQRFYQAATGLIPTLREGAKIADAQDKVSRENVDAIIKAGVSAAFVPESLGGFGVTSVQDWLAGIATLARGDGSSAIGINMHLGVSRGLSQAYEGAIAAGHNGDPIAAQLKEIVQGNMLICATATERGTDNLHPLTEATTSDEGWTINGGKMFVTLSPVATHLAMNLRMRDARGDHLVTTMLPFDTPGIEPQDDWQALGMRGSGSQSIKFVDVQVPKSAIRPIGPWGQWSTNVLINRTLGNLSLVAAFLGIAEHAHELAIAAVGQQKRLGQPVNQNAGVQHVVGEMEILLASCRSMIQSAGVSVDRFLLDTRDTPPTLEAAHGLMRDYQSAKWVVNKGAIDIVSKAMDLVGGGGYMAANTLSRLYRDVRAGPFMQPFSPTEARQYVGKVSLGILPES